MQVMKTAQETKKRSSPMSSHLAPNPYEQLKTHIGELLRQGRIQAGRAINTILVQTYWQIGRHIVEFEQKGNIKAEYGSELLDRLSKDLTAEFGKGFSRSNLVYIRKFYLTFPKSETLSHQLSWSHYFEILKVDYVSELFCQKRKMSKAITRPSASCLEPIKTISSWNMRPKTSATSSL